MCKVYPENILVHLQKEPSEVGVKGKKPRSK